MVFDFSLCEGEGKSLGVESLRSYFEITVQKS